MDYYNGYVSDLDSEEKEKEHAKPFSVASKVCTMQTLHSLGDCPRTCLETHFDADTLDKSTGWLSCCAGIGWIVSSVSSGAAASATGLLATAFGFAAFLSDSVETKKRDVEMNRKMDAGFANMDAGFANMNTNFAAIAAQLKIQHVPLSLPRDAAAQGAPIQVVAEQRGFQA
jgi:hypothetical protein